MTFEEFNLNPAILKAITACGYTVPTPIQEQSIPVVMQGNDLIATAQTGTGKTAAFVLPALERLTVPSTGPGKGPRILVLTPTRELAGQVMDAACKYGRGMRLRCGSILGGMPYRDQLRLLSAPVDIIVATPGRLLDHLERGSVRLDRLEMLILDEADRMLDMGFSEDMEKIVSRAPSARQTLMFTATMEKSVLVLAEKMLRDPLRIELAVRTSSHALIEQRLHVADNLSHKKDLLRHLVSDTSLTRAIIFSATKRDADELARELSRCGYPAAALHGDMNQIARNKTIERMRRCNPPAGGNRCCRTRSGCQWHQPRHQLRPAAFCRGLRPSHRPYRPRWCKRHRHFLCVFFGIELPGAHRALYRQAPARTEHRRAGTAVGAAQGLRRQRGKASGVTCRQPFRQAGW
jgi:superfamily II DNA/RNA helicase